MPELFTVITIAEARARLLELVTPLEAYEQAATGDVLDRVLARNLYAAENLPAFARSTMDGFAVRAADTFGASESLPAYLALAGEVPMGCDAGIQLAPGQAARIHTGGMLPAAADAVVMVEQTQQLDEHTIEVVRAVGAGENVIPIGDDVQAGALLFERGQRLRPQDLGGLVGLGITKVDVVRHPRVAILATGDEVVAPSETPQPGQVRDINTTTIAALVRQAGGEPHGYGIAPDDLDTLRHMAHAALAGADVLVISAGSSVSTRDITAQVISELGAPGVLVHGVAMHPGKPTILAVAGGKPVFGLPGNPVSTMIACRLFVVSTLLKLQGIHEAQPVRMVQARLTHNLASHAGVEDFVPARLIERAGEWWAEPVFGKSNLIYTLARADGLLRIPLDRAGLYAGDSVAVEVF